MFHFVTGHPRAGTHTYAANLSKEIGLPWIDERRIGLDEWSELLNLMDGKIVRWKNGKKTYIEEPKLKDGFILQCPFISQKTLDLAKLGKVYWCTRSHKDIAGSSANGMLGPMMWDLMKAYRNEFPEDPIWPTLQYKGREDVHNNFVGYGFLLAKVMRYFYQTRFQTVVEKRIVLEEQEYFAPEETSIFKRPMKSTWDNRIKEIEDLNESLCLR